MTTQTNYTPVDPTNGVRSPRFSTYKLRWDFSPDKAMTYEQLITAVRLKLITEYEYWLICGYEHPYHVRNLKPEPPTTQTT